MAMEQQKAREAEGSSGQGSPGAMTPTSPQSVLEEMSLQMSMDKNKESLKRKLLLRRSVNELVDQGIYPPLKSPAAFASQQKQLERAKTGDLLRHKIQSRPDRQALVQQHILEDSKVDPSLQERQRLLKKARLTDDLNERIAHRPGPLELVEDKILVAEQSLEQAIHEGQVTYNKTCEGEDVTRGGARHFLFDEDSLSSNGMPSPESDSDISQQSTPQSTPKCSIPSPPDIGPLLQRIQAATPGLQDQQTQHFTFSPPITTASFTVGTSGTTTTTSGGIKGSNGGGKIRKKQAKKTSSGNLSNKAKVIKFHEYKGPPNVVKTQNANTAASSAAAHAAVAAAQAAGNETPYHILLQQQQLFLQWQLEFQNRNHPVINSQQPSIQAMEMGQVESPNQTSASVSSGPGAATSPVQQPITSPTQQSQAAQKHPKIKTNLEDMKVADLKDELRKRGLTVSGAKPQLIERLRPYSETQPSKVSEMLTLPSTTNVGTIINIQSGMPQIKDENGNSSVMDISAAQFQQVTMNSMHPAGGATPMSPDFIESVGTQKSPVFNNFPLKKTTSMSSVSSAASSTAYSIDPLQLSRPNSVQSSLGAIDNDATSQLEQFLSLENELTQQLNSVGQLPLQQQAVFASPNSLGSSSHEEQLKAQQRKIDELQQQLLLLQHQQQLQQPQQVSPGVPSHAVLQHSPVGVVVMSSGGQAVTVPQSLAVNSMVGQPQLLQIGQKALSPVVLASSSEPVTTTTTPSVAGTRVLFQHPGTLHESLNLGQPKIKFTHIASGGNQPFVFTSTNLANMKNAVNKSGGSNGMNRALSVPSSPHDTTTDIKRSSSGSFIIPTKEPPKYDEAVRNKQQASPSPRTNSSDAKPLVNDQTMDDVLEILIRTGEMTPNSLNVQSPKMLIHKTKSCPNSFNNKAAHTGLSAASETRPPAFIYTAVTPIGDNQKTNKKTNRGKGGKGKGKQPPPPIKITPAISTSNGTFNINNYDSIGPAPKTSDIVRELSEHLDLENIDMDWADSDNFDLDNSTLGGINEVKGMEIMLQPSVSVIGVSEPNLAVLGLDDDMDSYPVNQDVSDWLDVIMPNTGFTPVSANAPMSFATGDPILTPKPQDVLELFNMEESDFNTPTDLSSGMNWDKLVETSTSS